MNSISQDFAPPFKLIAHFFIIGPTSPSEQIKTPKYDYFKELNLCKQGIAFQKS